MFLAQQEPLPRHHSLTPHFLPPPALLLPMSLPMCAPLRVSIIADAKDALALSETCSSFLSTAAAGGYVYPELT